MRRPIDLPLVRDSTPLFVLTWTAMHLIDEKSPFYGPDALRAAARRRAEIFLTLTGLDETIGQTIHARHPYTLDDIVPNARFADVLRSIRGRHARHRLPQVPRRGADHPRLNGAAAR